MTVPVLLRIALAGAQAPAAPSPTTIPSTQPSERDARLFDAVVNHDAPKALDLLKQGADANFRPVGERSSALYFAASHPGELELVKALVEHGADVNAKCIGGFTALHNACLSRNEHAAEFLVEKGANVKAQDTTGTTPLHLAAYVGSSDLCRLLLDHHADVNAVDLDGKTPLDIARGGKFRYIAAYLAGNGGLPGSEVKGRAAHSP